METQAQPAAFIIRNKLRDKIFLMMLAIGVVPIIIGGFVAYIAVTSSHEKNVAETQSSILRQKQEEISSLVDDIIENIFKPIFEFDVRGLNAKDDPDLYYLNIFLDSQPNFVKGFLYEQSALQDVSFISVQTREITRNNQKFLLQEGHETTRFRRSETGVIVDMPLRDQNMTEKFRVARSGKTYISDIYYTLRGPMVTIASPVRDKNGDLKAVLSGELGLEKLQSILKAKLGASGYLYLVDSDGYIVAKGDRLIPQESLRDLPLVGEVLSGKSVTGSENRRVYQNIFGAKVLGAGVPVEILKAGLIAEWPVSDVDAILFTLKKQIVIAAFIMLFAIIILSVLLTRQIVRPVKILETWTHHVAQGKFDAAVDIRTGDELEELGGSFNMMMAGLKELQALKDEFVFIAAHELRTPVAAIKGYLTLLLEGFGGPLSDKTKEFIQKVMDSDVRLVRLVDDLLEVARSEAGRLTIEVASVDIAEPIKGVLSELTPLADEKKISVAYEPGSLPKVMADAGRVKEIVVNLVGNSIKYMGHDNGRIEITHEKKDGMLVTHIKDDGLGMSKDAQQKLFQKFYRVMTEKTREIKGTGLGLFIVKQIIEKMNGTIWVESEEGKGSTFSFSLPIVE